MLNETEIRNKFDEKFGKVGPEGNTDSVGRDAGCDDCVKNIELREEHKQFVVSLFHQQMEGLRKEIEKMRKTQIEWKGTTDGEKNMMLLAFDSYNLGIKDVITLINNQMKQ